MLSEQIVTDMGDTSPYKDNAHDNKEMILCWPPPSPKADNVTDSDTVLKDATIPDHSKQTMHTKRVTPPVADDNVKRAKPEPDVEVGADVALARWWRNHQRSLLNSPTMTQSGANAHTRLMHIVRMPEAKAFMWTEVSRLESRLACRYEGDLASVHSALGTLYERLGYCTKAYHHLHAALTQDQSDTEMAWVLERVLRQLRVTAAQVTAGLRLAKTFPRCLQPPRQVARRAAESLTYEDFLVTYAMTHTPVVITGLGGVITKKPWTLDHIRQVAGACRLRPRCLVQGSAEWARLEPGPEMTVSELLTRVQHPTGADTVRPPCLFDWSLPLYCPELAAQLTVPKYFAGDLLQRTAEDSLYRDSWPSLFVAPPGAVSELHVDAFGSNFWMALLQGKKRWVFYQPDDTPLLYPRYWHSLDPIFDVDLSNPDLDQHPLVSLARPQEVTLEEGDVLFVPAGCPHRVENLTETVAISANYVDVSNVGAVRAELLAQGLVDPRAAELLAQLQAPGFSTAPDPHIRHLTFAQFKAQVRS